MTGMGADGKLGVQADEAAGLEDPGPGRGDQRGLRHADGGDQDGGGGSSVAVGEYRWADRAVGGALRAVLIAQKKRAAKIGPFFLHWLLEDRA